jgi:DNA-binding NarL/FixJ family response regulator
MTASDESRVCRMLLVDDSESYRSALAKLLSREKDVLLIGEAADGIAALELAHKLRPDVIIMDIQLPSLLKNEMIMLPSVAVGCRLHRGF